MMLIYPDPHVDDFCKLFINGWVILDCLVNTRGGKSDRISFFFLISFLSFDKMTGKLHVVFILS